MDAHVDDVDGCPNVSLTYKIYAYIKNLMGKKLIDKKFNG
jgi:hypothetical protein